MGANVPRENLIDVAKRIKPTHYLSFIVKGNQTDKTNNLLRYIDNELDNPNLYLCCSSDLGDTLSLASNQQCINSFDDFLSVSNSGPNPIAIES